MCLASGILIAAATLAIVSMVQRPHLLGPSMATRGCQVAVCNYSSVSRLLSITAASVAALAASAWLIMLHHVSKTDLNQLMSTKHVKLSIGPRCLPLLPPKI